SPRSGTVPSYPVFVDGFGVTSYAAPYTDWVAGQTNGIPRKNFTTVTTAQLIRQYFSASDDIVFGKNGCADGFAVGGTTVSVQRDGRYSWAYLVRRPKSSDPSTVDVTVVVFSGRSMGLSADTLLPLGEAAYTADFTQGGTTAVIHVPSGQAAPAIRRGG